MHNTKARLENALELYKSKLPKKPYHTNDYYFGKKIGTLASALKSRHIQPNSQTHKYFMIFDLDSDMSVFDWHDKNLPPPNLIVRNQDNGRSHMTYILKTSVKNDISGRLKPVKYYSDVEHGLAVKIQADMNYNGLLTKNPFNSSAYKVFSFEDQPYELDYLNEFVDKDLVRHQRETKKAKRIHDGFASGRNCTLFESLRIWAYSNWHRYYQLELRSMILDQAMMLNGFECPLDSREVETIAGSVYQFITHNFSIERLNELKSERAKQSRQKSKGNIIYTGEKPWETEGIPSSTYYYRAKKTTRNILAQEKPWQKLGMGRTKWYELGKPNKL